MTSVQIRSCFWFVFFCIRTEYRKIRTRDNSVFGHFSRSESSKMICAPSSNSISRLYDFIFLITWYLQIYIILVESFRSSCKKDAYFFITSLFLILLIKVFNTNTSLRSVGWSFCGKYEWLNFLVIFSVMIYIHWLYLVADYIWWEC